MVGSIDIKALNLDELAGVVNMYPWFAGARKELCRRMALMGGSEAQFASAALYMPSRKAIRDLVLSTGKKDYSDSDVQELIKAYFSSQEGEEKPESEGRKVFVVGGDYFSQAQYDGVRRSSDNIFSSFASKARAEKPQETEEAEFDLCTEALAQIYAEQGYPQEARRIYSKLCERFPDKSVYYASLAEKL